MVGSMEITSYSFLLHSPHSKLISLSDPSLSIMFLSMFISYNNSSSFYISANYSIPSK